MACKFSSEAAAESGVRLAADATTSKNSDFHLLSLLYDTGATSNLVTGKWEKFIREARPSRQLFNTVSGREKAFLDGKLGMLDVTAANTRYSYNLCSPQRAYKK